MIVTKMNISHTLRSAVLPFLCGVVLIILGSLRSTREVLVAFAVKKTHQELSLHKNSVNYKIWTAPIHLVFKAYLFNVTNPDAVMRGELPIFSECGPYVYNEVIEKKIIDVDSEKDEIIYTSTTRYSFSRDESRPATEKITILNPAYLGTILTLAQLPASFMAEYGNHISKLSPNRNSIFITARADDILFSGVKIKCNTQKFPELDMICRVMKTKKPPIIKDTSDEGVYLLSFFDKMNGSLQGPFNVNRGIKNVSRLGVIRALNGKTVQKIWNSNSCNELRGSVDSVLFPPTAKPPPFITVFSADLCRAIDIYYKDIYMVNGLMGHRYVMAEKMWSPEEIECYCPVEKKQPQCLLPKGLFDLSKCQDVPAIFSEPHFLHADPKLLQYARGLKPVEDRHLTYVVLEPRTGTPISGYKRMQMNLKLSRYPVDLLSNVSEGYFPLLWIEEGITPKLSVIGHTYQAQRTMQLLEFLQLVPLIVGIYIVLATLFFYGTPGGKPRNDNATLEPITLSSNRDGNGAIGRTAPQRPFQMFE